jgi:hypothetical protein
LQNEKNKIGYLNGGRNDFQNQDLVFIVNHDKPILDPAGYYWIYKHNLLSSAIFFAIRRCIDATWINHNDQFLYPSDGWQNDKQFQNDCLTFTLFHNKNLIISDGNANHWIPFEDREVGAKDNFQSTFMNDFIKNRKFSKEAKTVFDVGKALWKYYHEMIRHNDHALVDASLYEIREYFKGRDEKGKMKNKAKDEQFNELDADLRLALKTLAERVQPKVYEYGFLKK